ncbi:hypothetical protein CA2015_2857 [Cyclobacterium amurskyense]|uniref:Uncharacterized protein n=1 Tax=Cyclobacterium amurskyense TaxID=320787 RepID=A0A0H4PDD3_9BACT|nr:hypothetical protein CA2015_2857 [Cyclobacterium amurskyense]
MNPREVSTQTIAESRKTVQLKNAAFKSETCIRCLLSEEITSKLVIRCCFWLYLIVKWCPFQASILAPLILYDSKNLEFNGKTTEKIASNIGLGPTILNPKYAIDNLLRAEIASKSATSLLFEDFTIAVLC